MSEDPDLGGLERRATAVGAVRQVLHALWGISRAQLPRVEAAAAEASLYLDWVDRIVERLAGAPTLREHQHKLSVVFGPERPYCGSLSRQLLALLPPDHALGLVGTRFVEELRSHPGVLARVRFQLPGANSETDVDSVATRVAEEVLKLSAQTQVELIYPALGGQPDRPVVLLSLAREANSNPPETYSPLPTVLRHALEEAVTGRLNVAVVEALRAEVRARVAAAEQAKKACDDKLEELERGIRVARQEQVTSELLEVVAGRQATLKRMRGPA